MFIVSKTHSIRKCGMFYLPGISLIFYLITLSDAVNLKIDGLIDLGPNWSYEYRIVGPAENGNGHPKHAIARHGRHHLPELNLNEEKEEQELKDEVKPIEEETQKEELKPLEEESQKEIERTKEEENPKEHKHHKTEEKHKKDKSKHSDTTPEPETTKTTKFLDIFASPHYEPVTFSSQSEHGSSSLDSSEELTTPKAATMFDIYDFTTTRRPKNTPPTDRKEKKKSKHKEADDEPMMENIDEDYRIKKPVQREHVAVAPKGNKTKKNEPTTPGTTTSTPITTRRTGDIFSDPHKVKDDAKINDFTNHLYKQTLKVFDTIKQKTNQYHLKREVDVLARSYEDKFREFLTETRHQKIKTRLGTQKVILNTIDMSNRILKRLINFMIGDMDKKGVLRNNVATANIFQKEIDKEQNLELTHACKKFGICRTGSGFPEFLTDMLAIMLRSDDKKFQHTFDSLTEAVKNADYNHILPSSTEKKLKGSIDDVEKVHIGTLRPMFMILKNIISNKNKPMIVNTIAGGSRVNATLAFLEIIDLLDQNLPQNEANQLEWNDIKISLTDFSEGKRFDVQEIMETFIKHLKKAVKSMDSESQKIVAKNLNIILEA